MFGTGRTFPIHIISFLRFPGFFIVIEMIMCRDLICMSRRRAFVLIFVSLVMYGAA